MRIWALVVAFVVLSGCVASVVAQPTFSERTFVANGALESATFWRGRILRIPGDTRERGECLAGSDIACHVLPAGVTVAATLAAANGEPWPRCFLSGAHPDAVPPEPWQRVGDPEARPVVWARNIGYLMDRGRGANGGRVIGYMDDPPFGTPGTNAHAGPFPDHLQGIAIDPAGDVYWSFTDRLVKTDSQGRKIAEVAARSHLGDLAWRDGKLYVAVNHGKFNDANAEHDSWLAVHDATTLAEIERHALPEVRYGAGGVCFAGDRIVVVGGLPREHVDDPEAANEVHEYDLAFRHVRTVRIGGGWTRLGIQTAEFAFGRFFFGCCGPQGPRILAARNSSRGPFVGDARLFSARRAALEAPGDTSRPIVARARSASARSAGAFGCGPVAGCDGTPRCTLVASPDLKHVERFDGADCAYGVAATPTHLVVARGERRDDGHHATLEVTVPAWFLLKDDVGRYASVPLRDGRVDLAELGAAVLGAYGYDAGALRLPSVAVDVSGLRGRVLLAAARKATLDTVTFRKTLGDRRLTLVVDQVKLRERRRDVRARLVGWFGALAGEDLARREFALAMPEDDDATQPLVLLVHGVEGSAGSMADLRAWLAAAPRGLRVATFRYPNDESAERVAAELAARLRAVAPREVAIVAHSFGGLIAREVVESPSLDPGNVTRLVLVGTPNGGSSLAGLRVVLEAWAFGKRVAGGHDGAFAAGFVDGLGEAGGDLQPGSVFLRRLAARPRNPRVAYHAVLGTRAPFARGDVERLQQIVAGGLRRAGVGRLLQPKVAACFADLDEVVDGRGDGVVSVARSSLPGVTPFLVRLRHDELLAPRSGDQPVFTFVASALK